MSSGARRRRALVDDAVVRDARLREALAARRGERGVERPGVGGIGVAPDEAAVLEPPDEAGQPAGREHHGVREIGHPHLAPLDAVEGDEHVELADSETMGLVEPAIELAQETARHLSSRARPRGDRAVRSGLRLLRRDGIW